MHGEVAGMTHPVKSAQFAGLEDHFQMRVAAGSFAKHDLIEPPPDSRLAEIFRVK